MSTAPTVKERKQLDKVSRAKLIHFILLVALICIASLTFLFPNDITPAAVVIIGVSIILVGLSSMRLQYFQPCPRCSTRMSQKRSTCATCGLEYHLPAQDVENEDLGT